MCHISLTDISTLCVVKTRSGISCNLEWVSRQRARMS